MSKSLARRMLTSLALVASGVALLAPGTQAAPATPRPAGALRPARSQLVTSGKLVCVKLRGSWQPATRLRGGWVITHDQQRRNATRLAARSRGARRRAQLRTAAAWRRKQAQQRPACVKAARRAPRRSATPVPQPPVPQPPVVKPPAPPAPTPLRFDLAGAVGLALPSISGAARFATRAGATDSPLIKVDADGGQQSAIASGTAKVRQVVVGPDDAAYVAFDLPVFLDEANGYVAPPGAGCVLARVPRSNGAPTCVDRDLQFIQRSWRPSNPAIQFGPGGSVYYLGSSRDGATVLRRNAGGAITTLVADHITVKDFLVLPDGSVLVDGRTTTTGTAWLRRIVPGGGIQTVENGEISFLRAFPDGNAYYGSTYGANGLTSPGVSRFLTATGTRDPSRWLGRGGEVPAPHVDLGPICGDDFGAFCGQNGSSLVDGVAVAGSYYGIAASGNDAELVRYYQDVSTLPTAVVRPTQIAAAGATSIVLAGLDGSNRNVLTRFDVVSETEQALIGADDEIEIYHLRHQPTRNRVLFDGLRYADNKVVVGHVDLGSGAVDVTPVAGGAKWEAFEAFG